MSKRPVARRLADALISLVTWVAAAVAVMWFYDWVSRWYVVVAVLLVIVAGASLGDLLKAERAAPSTDIGELLPAQREAPVMSDVADVTWLVATEQPS